MIVSCYIVYPHIPKVEDILFNFLLSEKVKMSIPYPLYLLPLKSKKYKRKFKLK